MPAFYILPTTASKPQNRTLYRNIRFMANNEVPSSKLARKRQSKTARPKVTVAAGIANVAASLSSFAIQQRMRVALEPSYLCAYHCYVRPPPPPPPWGEVGDLTFIKANRPWLGDNNRSNVVRPPPGALGGI